MLGCKPQTAMYRSLRVHARLKKHSMARALTNNEGWVASTLLEVKAKYESNVYSFCVCLLVWVMIVYMYRCFVNRVCMYGCFVDAVVEDLWDILELDVKWYKT